MNELTIAPTKKANSISNILPVFAVFLLIKEFPRINVFFRNIIDKVTSNNLIVNKNIFDRIDETVSILIKVGPYLPESIINTLNYFIPTFDKISKAIKIIDFITNYNSFAPIVSVKNLNEKERLNKIITLANEELPKETSKKIKPFLEIISNIDMYKAMIETLTTFSNSSDGSNKNQLENMIDVIMPLMGGDKEKNKIKDMIQMMEILKLLSSDDKKEDNK